MTQGAKGERRATSLVFISGASSGLGRALVDTLPYRPARVIGICRRSGAGFEHLPVDLSEPEGWHRVAQVFEREIPGFRGERVIFVHAAGTLDPIGFAGDVYAGAYWRNVLLNAASPAVLGDAFLRATRRSQARADLVLISSGAAHHVYEGWSGYCAGKAAVDQWTRTVGAEQARRKTRCRVLAVAPGIVATPMQEHIRRTLRQDFPSVERFAELHRSGELRDPQDAAREIWSLLERELENGAVIDLRALGTASE